MDTTISITGPDVGTTEELTSTTDLEGLFDAHHQRLYGLAIRLVSDPERARDLVQETFLRAARKQATIPPGAAEAWLVRVMVNLCRDRWRRLKVRRDHAHEVPAPAVGSSVESATMARQSVRWALSKLPARRRAVIVLRELEDRDTGEISSLLGMRPATVRWHLSQGRRQLRALLETPASPPTANRRTS